MTPAAASIWQRREQKLPALHRGYIAIGLHQPKSGENVGGVMRAAGCYGAMLVVLGGERRPQVLMRHPTDTMKEWRHVPVITSPALLDVNPYDCVPVAIEISPRARSLPTFAHPERAYYLFGPEDGSIPNEVMDRCAHIVSVPTRKCMNLAATVNVVLYDRAAKLERAKVLP